MDDIQILLLLHSYLFIFLLVIVSSLLPREVIRVMLTVLLVYNRPELLPNCSLVRELHVYGTAIPVHTRDPTKVPNPFPNYMRLLLPT